MRIQISSILLFFSLGFLCQAQSDTRGYIVKIGDQAPNFKTQLTSGKTVSLDEFRGKIVMLQFTASWCGVCRKEMPFIEKEIWQPLKNKHFILLGIDRDEPLEVVKEFATKTEITYPMCLDPKANIFALFAEREAGVTRNVVIDENGKIIFMTRLYDPVEFETMKKVIFKEVSRISKTN